ncbi:hypothetical protein [Roseibacillus persicicus]|uniref:hypothetical protein n=1 Tax=Roseibacillus persicicus TaxID=454148 RepID=UPI00280F2A03|nr:hypothetical protein [Roseibacillus persicicus]MDQ8191021.1 hypothetical protein [Roseibacillus persicicus]
MSKNRAYLVVAVFLCLAAVFLTFLKREAFPLTLGQSRQKDPANQKAAGFYSQEKNGGRSNQPLNQTNFSLQHLRDFGFKISATRITPSSAEGALKVISPDGTVITGEDLRYSTKQKSFVVTGAVKIVQNRGALEVTLESVSPEGFVSIPPHQMNYSASETGWTTSTK